MRPLRVRSVKYSGQSEHIKEFVTVWTDAAGTATRNWVEIMTTNPLLKTYKQLFHRGNGNGSVKEEIDPNEQDSWRHRRSADSRGDLNVGDWVEFSKSLSDRDVKRFAFASGDTNPLHLDDDYAIKTRFQGRIVHGTLINGLISAALARLPGEVIYLSNSTKFLKPVSLDQTVTARCEIVEDMGDHQYRLQTSIETEEGEQVVEGEATVLIDEVPEDESPKRDCFLGVHS